MTKMGMARAIADALGLSRDEAERGIEYIISTIKKEIAAGSKVTLRNFGSFEAVERAARIGRNPATGVEAKIGRRRVVKFRPGKRFKDALNRSV